MVIKIEKEENISREENGYLMEQIQTEIRKKILVRSKIEIIDPGVLPRTQRKSKRVFDDRNEK
jgi:phenylacetate-CoA ligase